MPYRTVEDRDSVQDNLRTDDPRGEQHSSLPSSLLDADRRWTTGELVAEVGVCHKTVLHILHDILGYQKLAVRWIHHEISEVQQWHHYAVAQIFLDRY